jgi:hypothetical protein
MDRYLKSLLGALLLLLGAGLASVQAWSLFPIAAALVVVGAWMAITAAVGAGMSINWPDSIPESDPSEAEAGDDA